MNSHVTRCNKTTAAIIARRIRTVIALPVALVVGGVTVAHGEGRFSAGRIAACDSLLSDSLSQLLIVGTGRFPRALKVDFTVAGIPTPLTLYHDRTHNYLWREPISCFQRVYWFPTDDIATITLHRVVEISRYVRQSPDDEDWSNGRLGWRAIVSWDTSQSSDYELADLDLGKVAFPDMHGVRDSALEVGFLRLSGQPMPLLYAVMELVDGDEDTYLRLENVGFWHFYGDRFAPLGMLELSRRYGESMGIDRLDLETMSEIRDWDDDGDEELALRRTYIIADDGRQTEFSDPQPILFEFAIGDPPPPPSSSVGNVSGIAPNDPRYIPPPERKPTVLRPTHMIVTDGQKVPIRPSLPILLFPGELTFGDFQSIRFGTDWSAYSAPPKGGGHVITLGKNRISPYDIVGSEGLRNPSLAMRLIGDSLEFEASVFSRMSDDACTELCQDGSYSFLLWIDSRLLTDFGDPECNYDDQVYHIRLDSTGLKCVVSRHSVTNTGGDFTISQADQSFAADYQAPRSGGDLWPHLFRWKLSQVECGLAESNMSIHACGLAVEMVCDSGFDPMAFDYRSGGLSYPVGFNRTDPRTWGTVIIAGRKDTTYVDR